MLVLLIALVACSAATIPVGILPATPTSPAAIVVTGKLLNATQGNSVWIAYNNDALHHRVKALTSRTYRVLAARFNQLRTCYRAQQSMSRRGNCYNNATPALGYQSPNLFETHLSTKSQLCPVLLDQLGYGP
ncbi:hypothetical protein [Hymenobacter volaticus]|uniref:Uncharacterized protein n=1 Tax=Hymenobacter volaticus TaxID=2932254 RepID=A0ABY4GGC9_9BACT|nr:hypothetical protein [Hymenobacter volaticus]UOQ69354.1 hypothetical protein MUN86_27040 [Hymenobacter volaticus]